MAHASRNREKESRGLQKKWHITFSARINYEQLNLMLPLQLISYHITITSYYIFKPLRHRPALLINKML